MGDRRVVALTEGARLRLVWIEADGVVQEVVRRHRLEGEAARLAGELVVANLLLAAWTKGEERVSLQVQGESPWVSFHGQVTAGVSVRARMAPARWSGQAHALHGMMLAIKDDGSREMYRGVSPLEGAGVGQALQDHLESSDQVLTRVRIGVNQGSARGLLVEQLPLQASVSARAAEVSLPGWVSADWEALQDVVESRWVDEQPLEVVEEGPVSFACPCSRDRVRGMLLGLGAEELQDMLRTDQGAEVVCEFCQTAYRFDAAQLGALVTAAQAPEV